MRAQQSVRENGGGPCSQAASLPPRSGDKDGWGILSGSGGIGGSAACTPDSLPLGDGIGASGPVPLQFVHFGAATEPA
jgi:hypothetical protein